MAGATASGASLGFWMGGGLGFAGGPFGEVTVPGGAAGGSALFGTAGGAVGLATCAKKTSGSDSGGSPEDATPQYKKPKPGLSGTEGAKDVPEWARGQRPLVTEDGKKFAQRLWV